MQINTQKKRSLKLIISILIFLSLFFAWAGLTKAGYIPNILNIKILCSGEDTNQPTLLPGWIPGTIDYKPVIYLYPEKTQDVYVQLTFNGKIIADYPEYEDDIQGWKVTAHPDGTLINKKDGLEYSYLFWEGLNEEKIDWDLSTGFVVKGSDTKEFLQNKLVEIGLTPKEYNEFIVYWYPLMQENDYNLIHFADKQYTDTANLTVTPQPDSILRVFMVYKPLEEPVEIQEQNINYFERKGFTVVEWGGTIVN